MISLSTGASNVPNNAQPLAKKKEYSHYEGKKKMEVDTPDNQHLVIENNGTAISLMSTNQKLNKGAETQLCLRDVKDSDLQYTFIKPAGDDTFTYGGTSFTLNKIQAMPTGFRRTKDGNVSVCGIAEVKGDLKEAKRMDLGYTEKEGLPIVIVDLAGLNQPHIQELLKRGLISPKLQLQGKSTGLDDLTRVQNWQVVPPKEGFKDVAMANDIADKLKPTVADWYQQVHPDLLLKEAEKLPSPTLQELGVSVVTTTTTPEI
jgi:hypothetical protein